MHQCLCLYFFPANCNYFSLMEELLNIEELLTLDKSVILELYSDQKKKYWYKKMHLTKIKLFLKMFFLNPIKNPIL